MKAKTIVDLVEGVTKPWAKQRKAEERDRSALANRRLVLTRMRSMSIKEAAYQVMQGAYMQASDNAKLPANARQVMYAARPKILQLIDKDLGSKFDQYFTQTLLPDYMVERGVDWDIVFDARGRLTEPHTDLEVPLGTLGCRAYLASIRAHRVDAINTNIREIFYPTLGPKLRYGAILFVEKEGFAPLFKAVTLADRYDIAIMSTKGMSVTASRQLVENLCARYGVPLLVLHDFDVSGFSIFGTLRSSTRRHHYTHHFEVIDLGLRLADVEAEGLDSESVFVSDKALTTLRRHGATPEEIEFLLGGERVELNAMGSRQFVAFIERKLVEHGIEKIVPDDTTIADSYRRAQRAAVVQKAINERLKELGDDDKSAAVPDGLRERIEAALKANPAKPWDAAVMGIAMDDIGESRPPELDDDEDEDDEDEDEEGDDEDDDA